MPFSLNPMKVNSKSKPNSPKQQEKVKKTIQDLIPLKDLEEGVLITPENKMIMSLKVSALNLELASNAECNELFDLFEGFLMSLSFPIQFTNVSMPVDLSSYISEQKRILNQTKNPYRRMLQESYIEFAREIEVSQDIMQRHRFVIFSQMLKEDTPQSRYETRLELEEKKDDIISGLSELDLTAEPVTDLDMIRYLHALFDYTAAQNRPIESSFVPQIIEGGK